MQVGTLLTTLAAVLAERLAATPPAGAVDLDCLNEGTTTVPGAPCGVAASPR